MWLTDEGKEGHEVKVMDKNVVMGDRARLGKREWRPQPGRHVLFVAGRRGRLVGEGLYERNKGLLWIERLGKNRRIPNEPDRHLYFPLVFWTWIKVL